jgi:hypothetical protein
VKKIIGYMIVFTGGLAFTFWVIIPLYYLDKHQLDLTVMSFALIGYYGTGFWLWKKYGTKIKSWVNNTDLFKHL